MTPERPQPSAEEEPAVCYSGAPSSPRARRVYPPGEAQRASGEGGTTVTYETVNGERKHQQGILEGFDVSADDANDLIMKARLKAGWITEADLAPAEEDEEAEGSDEVGEEA